MELSRDAIEQLDRKLAGLGRREGALRLRIGELLEAMRRRGWYQLLGCSSLAAYVLERCNEKGRWGIDSAALARKLDSLPLLRAALANGVLDWSMVELLARRAKPENEAELIDEASRTTFRRMRERLNDDSPTPDANGRVSISVTISQTDAWALEHTLWFLSLLEPKATGDDRFHFLLAEGLTSLPALAPESDLREPSARADELRRISAAWRAQRKAWCAEAEARVEPNLDLTAVNDFEPEEWEPPAATPKALDAQIRAIAAELASRDLMMGAMAEELWRSNGWRRLGYASATQYASERVGVSLSSLKTKRALARRTERLPRVAEAIAERRLGFESALLVTRVATDATVEAWLKRAAQATIKHLREEVEAAELVIRMGGSRDQLPPDAAALAALAERRRRVSETMTTSDAKAPFGDRVRAVLGQMSGEPTGRARGKGSVSYRFWVSEETRELWDEWIECCRAISRWLPERVSPIRLLCVVFCVEWLHALAVDAKYARIHARDDFRCQSPLCNRRDVTPHHLIFRSRGGGEEDENIISLCFWCHLFGVHLGLILAEPPASDVHWELGLDPILIVDGRIKKEAA